MFRLLGPLTGWPSRRHSVRGGVGPVDRMAESPRSSDGFFLGSIIAKSLEVSIKQTFSYVLFLSTSTSLKSIMAITRVFVAGATGTQGGALARHLRAKNIEVHALARDIASQKAQDLVSIGVKFWVGDFNNKSALTIAITGCDALFLNFMPDLTNLSAEEQWAQSILDAGKEAGAQHVVFSSVYGVDQTDKMRWFDEKAAVAEIYASKHSIEKIVKASGYATWTVLRPGYFMANCVQPFVQFMLPGLAETGELITALRSDTVLPLTDTKTIGLFSSAAIMQPERFNGKTISYLDELLTLSEFIERLSQAVGRELKITYLSDDEVEAQRETNPILGGQLVTRDMAQFANLDQVKSLEVPLGTFEEYLKREREAVNATYNKSS
ncbi:NAD dependent epimerase/dehydratase, putative [Talaromyces stipitatus ATCC 10500]|uniref:NAD dependent epimerase/dehydratase, putative n=1 Tax=Talaromyces stipitatus (strain ATCC 10500 / CBS 375.48 / QM 6759 / NRRL 1006) TaxID=441959 RepID=B8MM04_TALSN|nr:NAD dependent epimerase/dehydratase, putative [Talaromyces stipitatus ATCC 10500]EED13516.1 NAD dependent epimerase/dehydratase, putative [Talaromyces stipitatus ATCC 10500]